MFSLVLKGEDSDQGYLLVYSSPNSV